MRSMLHHRELEKLKGRDCDHECRVCRVKEVGLSAYANHISSQLHKNNVDAHNEELDCGREYADEEYFDKELIELIQKRKEQSLREANCNAAREFKPSDQMHQRRKGEERDPFLFEEWQQHGPPQREWEWENVVRNRQGNYPHLNRSSDSKWHNTGNMGPQFWHPSSRGEAVNWHNNPGNSRGPWQPSLEGQSEWHAGSGPERNSSWLQEGPGCFPKTLSNNCSGNWNSGQQNPNWNFGGSRSAFPSISNWPVGPPSVAQGMPLVQNNNLATPSNYNKEKYPWEWCNSERSAKDDHFRGFPFSFDFTNDMLPAQGAIDFSLPEQMFGRSDKMYGRNTGCKEKALRWVPYPSQRSWQHKPASKNNSANKYQNSCPPPLASKKLNAGKLNEGCNPVESKKCLPGSSKNKANKNTNNNEKRTFKTIKVPPLNSTTVNIPSACLQKKGAKPLTKGVKSLSSFSSSTGCTPLNALNLETNKPSSFISRFRYAGLQNQKNKSIPDRFFRGPTDKNLREVLRRAKEVLQSSQSVRRQHSSSVLLAQEEKARISDSDMAKDILTTNQLKTNISENVSDFCRDQSDCEKSKNKELVKSNSISDDSISTPASVLHSAKSMKALQWKPSGRPLPFSYAKASSFELELPASVTCVKSDEESNQRSQTEGTTEGEEPRYGDFHETDDFENCTLDSEFQKDDQPSGPFLSELSKLGIPASLQRDLTRHMAVKSKVGSVHLPEPNLNIARRIRNVGEHRKSESEKECGLKPTVKQLLNASRRNVNWDQVLHQVTKKKQELGKGLPRFGIEMVPPPPTEVEACGLEEEPDLSSLEGFQWEGISVSLSLSTRKRSLSESSVVAEKVSSVYNFFENSVGEFSKKEEKSVIPRDEAAKQSLNPDSHSNIVVKRENSSESDANILRKRDISPCFQVSCSSPGHESEPRKDLRRCSAETSVKMPDVSVSVKTEEHSESCSTFGTDSQGPYESGKDVTLSTLSGTAGIDGASDSSCTSGTEQNDCQGLGKKRRATADGSSPEAPSLERTTKRRKIKNKKERSQVDSLLNISLREEELSKSLQSLENSFVQARATLQAAYVEVQRLIFLKQQMTTEMNALRAQRIYILQGLQEAYDQTEDLRDRSTSTPAQNGHSITEMGKQDADHLTSPCSPVQEAPPVNTSQPLLSDTAVSVLPHLTVPSAFQTSAGRTAVKATTAIPDSSLPVKQEHISSVKETEAMNADAADPNSAVPLSDSLYKTTIESPLPVGQSNDNMQLNSPDNSVLPPRSLAEETEDFCHISHQEKSASSLCDGSTNTVGDALTSHDLSKNQTSVSIKEESCNSQTDSFTLRDEHNTALNTHSTNLQTVTEDDLKPDAEQQAESLSVETRGGKKKKKLKKKKSLRATRVPDNSDTEQDVDPGRYIRKLRARRSPQGGRVTTTGIEEQVVDVNKQEAEKLQEENELGSEDSDSSVEVVDVVKPAYEIVAIDSSDSADEMPDSPSKTKALASSKQGLGERAKYGCDEVTSTSELGTTCTDGIKSITDTASSVQGSKNSSEVSSEPEEDEITEGPFLGHQAAVNFMQIFNGLLYTCSADKTVRVFSLSSRKCIGTFEGHTTKVNCLLITKCKVGTVRLYTGSSDHIVRCYDVKTRQCVEQLTVAERVLCLHSRWRMLFVGLANGNVATFSLKDNKRLDVFECHGPRAVSCLASAQEGARKLLLVGSYDCSITVRDANNGLLLRTLEGHTKTVLCMKVVNDLVFSGSSDQSVHAHNIHTGELIRIYKGHSHAVTVVNILGKVMVTACLDKLVRVYELQSDDRLQVYGGHTDMIMCMAIHKSMIYTGCYDGSIQAVRLNLLQNYRCWWHGCCLIFGVLEHLKHHLMTDHVNPNFYSLKCRWRSCDTSFAAKKCSKQDAQKHLCQHAEEDSRLDP